MRAKVWIEVDHTSLNMEFLDECSSPPAGRPMLICSIDQATRYGLNFTLTFCPPNEPGKETFTQEPSFITEPGADSALPPPDEPENGSEFM